MNDRQKALLAYVMAIGPHVKGFKSIDDLTNRIMRCVREDAAFVAMGFTTGFIEAGRRVIEKKATETLNTWGKMAGEFVSNMSKGKK